MESAELVRIASGESLEPGRFIDLTDEFFQLCPTLMSLVLVEIESNVITRNSLPISIDGTNETHSLDVLPNQSVLTRDCTSVKISSRSNTPDHFFVFLVHTVLCNDQTENAAHSIVRSTSMSQLSENSETTKTQSFDVLDKNSAESALHQIDVTSSTVAAPTSSNPIDHSGMIFKYHDWIRLSILFLFKRSSN